MKNILPLFLLFSLSFDTCAAIFERLIQSKTHENIYFQYLPKGTFRNGVSVYEISPDGWRIKDVLVFRGIENYVDFEISKVSVNQQFLYAASYSQIIRFELDQNGLPVPSSRKSVWKSPTDSYRPLLMSNDGRLFYTYDRDLDELYLYIENEDTFELVDQKSNVYLSEYGTSVHPDGSLMTSNSVYPLNGNKIGELIRNNDLSKYDVHQDASLGKNLFFRDNGDVIFKTNTAYNGGYIAKLNWPVAEKSFNYTKLIETKDYSADPNFGEVEDFWLSADQKWLVITESNHYSAEFYLFQLDKNFNVVSHWYLDEQWFSSNVADNDSWRYYVGMTQPIQVGDSLWIGNLQLDVNDPTRLLSVQNISFMQSGHITRYSSYQGYDDDLVVIPEGDRGAIRLRLDETGKILSREPQMMPLEESLIQGTSPESRFDFTNIEADVFEQGNINNFSIGFDSQYSTEYDSFFEENWTFDTIGFVDSKTLVVYAQDFPHRVKVKKFPHSVEFVNKPLPELTLNQDDVLVINVADYVNLPENASVTILEFSDYPTEKYDVIYESNSQNIEFKVTKALALRQDNQMPMYIELHVNEWKFRAQLRVTIENINEPPIAIAIEPQKLDKGDQYIGYLGELFDDPDFDFLIYQVTGLPNGLVHSGDSISGSVTKSGTYSVKVTATDEAGHSVENQFDIVVSGDDSVGSLGWHMLLLCILIFITRFRHQR